MTDTDDMLARARQIAADTLISSNIRGHETAPWVTKWKARTRASYTMGAHDDDELVQCALSALRSSDRVAEGFVVVPARPTEEMAEAFYALADEGVMWPCTMEEAWETVLAAAPRSVVEPQK